MVKKYNFILLFLSLFCFEAQAGAWLKQKGESDLSFQYEYKTLFTYYHDQEGQKHLAKIYFFDLYSLYYQYGLKENINLIIEEKWYNYQSGINIYKGDDSESYNLYQQSQLMYEDNYRKFENNPFESRFLVQTSLWSSENAIISFQPGVEFYNNNLDRAVEMNLLYGHAFKLGKEYSFINIEFGVGENTSTSKYYNEAKHTQMKLEATIGLAVTSKNMLLLQLFNSNKVGIFRDQKITTGQISWRYKYNESLSWQTGYSSNLTKRDQFRAESIITGITLKF